MTLDKVAADTTPADTPADVSGEPAGMALEDFSANEAACRVWSNTDEAAYVYHCSAKGFEGTNKATITVDASKGTITSIEVTEFNDTTGVGDTATTADELGRYAGATINSTIDATAGASMTSGSLRAMAAKALNMAAGK